MAATYPSRIDITPWGYWEYSANSLTRNVETVLGFGYLATDGTVNTSGVGWKVALRSGTWSATLIGYRGAERGIATLELDATSLGTLDFYDAGGGWNTVKTLSGFTVSTDGVYMFKVTAPTKNASATGYHLAIQHIVLQRTGA